MIGDGLITKKWCRITRKDEKALRTKAATFTTLETRKDGVKFTSPSLKPLADKYKALDDEYSAIQVLPNPPCPGRTAVIKTCIGYLAHKKPSPAPRTTIGP